MKKKEYIQEKKGYTLNVKQKSTNNETKETVLSRNIVRLLEEEKKARN